MLTRLIKSSPLHARLSVKFGRKSRANSPKSDRACPGHQETINFDTLSTTSFQEEVSVEEETASQIKEQATMAEAKANECSEGKRRDQDNLSSSSNDCSSNTDTKTPTDSTASEIEDSPSKLDPNSEFAIAFAKLEEVPEIDKPIVTFWKSHADEKLIKFKRDPTPRDRAGRSMLMSGALH